MKTSKAFRMTVLAGVWIWCLHGVARADSNDAPASLPATPLTEAGAEHFVPHVSRIDCDGTIQMIRSVELNGNAIRVRDVARWSDADSVGFSGIADLVIDHFDDGTSRRISMDELRSTLKGAGVNLAQVQFAGAGSCLVTRNQSLPVQKLPRDDHEVVQKWIEDGSKAYRGHPTETAAKPAAPAPDDAAEVKVCALRDLLLEDLSQRLNLPIDDLQLTFDPRDRAYLGLTEPAFQFQLEPRRINDLGKISWDVTISSGKNEQKVTINANARVWERQLVVGNSISYRQVLKDSDLTERRVLVDHVESDPLLTRKQIVGQQASRDLKPGMVLTSRMLDPIPLVKQGDFVTVTLKSGGVCIRTVATAMEPGSYGQSIRVKDAANQNVFVVTMTGPQEGVMGPAEKPEVAEK